MATDVRVIYHYEGSWWADSPDIEKWSAAADDLDDLIALVTDGVPFALESDDVRIKHLPAPDLMEIFKGRTAGARLRVTYEDMLAGIVGPSDVPNPTLVAAA